MKVVKIALLAAGALVAFNLLRKKPPFEIPPSLLLLAKSSPQPVLNEAGQPQPGGVIG